MERFHLRRALRDARVSRFEEHSLVVGTLLVVVATVFAWVGEDAGGSARMLGTVGLGAFGACALSHATRLYRADVTAAVPDAVGRVGIRIRPRRIVTAATAAFALVLPAVAAVVLLVAVGWGWLALAGVVLIGSLAMLVTAIRTREDELRYTPPSVAPTALLERLCMRADTPIPELVVEPGPEANAWTTRGRIHVTRPLLKLLDQSEVEAVVAHELAHVAHRDAAVMDVCSAPSRVLLGFAGLTVSGFRVWMRNFRDFPFPRLALIGVVLAAFSIPPAFVLGWVSRLSLLVMSRTREFAADAAAAALTGRPSALASALVKLDDEADLLPWADLRQAQARAVQCILGIETSRLGPVFCTHPRTATRVKRLQAIEERVQARPGAR
jgi:heat shock protein HtpX